MNQYLGKTAIALKGAFLILFPVLLFFISIPFFYLLVPELGRTLLQTISGLTFWQNVLLFGLWGLFEIIFVLLLILIIKGFLFKRVEGYIQETSVTNLRSGYYYRKLILVIDNQKYYVSDWKKIRQKIKEKMWVEMKVDYNHEIIRMKWYWKEENRPVSTSIN